MKGVVAYVRYYVITLLIVGVVLPPVLPVNEARAVRHSQLYFGGSGSAYQTDCPVIEGGYSGGANVESFIAKIIASYNYTGTRGCAGAQPTGAAYIVHTMLGRPATQSKTISAADWAEWAKRVRASTIETSSINVLNQINSSAPYRSSPDVGQFTDVRNQTYATTQFKNPQGQVVYIFKNACGNPIGDNPGVPPVAVDYNLIPRTTTSGGNSASVETGSTFPAISYDVDKTGGAPTSKSTNWQLARCVYTPGYAPASNYTDAAANNTLNAVATYTARGGTCRDAGSGTTTFSLGSSNLGTISNDAAGTLAVGARVCYILSVSPPADTAAANVWRHSTPTCIVIKKSPKVQVLGGDLRIGGLANTSTSTRTVVSRTTTTYTYGSWVEYGIFAVGGVTGTASGSALANGQASSVSCSTVATTSRASLTFTNSAGATPWCNASTVVGQYTASRTLPDIAALFSTTSAPLIGTNDLADQSKRGVFTTNGTTTPTLSLAGGTITPGRWVVINAPDTTITITSNINYDDTTRLSSIADIPQVVIIAKNIIVADGVTNIDAWLVAKGADTATDGKIITCQTAGELVRITGLQCVQPLNVNGPVIANKLFLGRTAGSGGPASQAGEPAEIFDLRPDAYLWAYYHATTNGRVQTVFTTELPPRL